MNTETKYIYKEPYQGNILNTLVDGVVSFTGEEIRTETIGENGSTIINITYKGGETFEEYNKRKGGGCKVVNEEELRVLIEEHNNSLITEFKEITEDRYFDLLECLPPLKHHTYRGAEIFFISEALTGNLHTCCVGINNKYYSATRKRNESSESITNFLNK